MIRIKKYSNRRLYNTSTSSYVNIAELTELIRSGEIIEVVDANSGENLTGGVLLQILMDEQGAGDILPAGLLHRIIRTTVDHPMQKLAMGQLAAGLQMLDQQLAVFDARVGGRGRPRPASGAHEPPAPGPAPTEPPADEEPPGLPPRASRPSQDPAPPQDDELDSLRARLAALENRLT